MDLAPFPSLCSARWRRLDVTGQEDAEIQQASTGWELRGKIYVEELDQPTNLQYDIRCNHDWVTLSALVTGETAGTPFRFEVERREDGSWWCNGSAMPELQDTTDIDLGFTPATNTLPIRRLGLEVGASAPVNSAWLRFPELRLERLRQTYTRESADAFSYRALVDGEEFTARLDTTPYGLVMKYEGLWELEAGG